jgi:CRP-like cAMP-binding protein
VYASLAVGGTMLGAALVAPAVSLLGLQAALILFGVLPAVVAVLGYPRLRLLDEQVRARRDQLAPAVARFRAVPTLTSISQSALERLAAAAALEQVGPNLTLVKEGDLADAFYVVVEGRLAVASTGGAAVEPRALADLGPGDCFGEIGLLHRRPRTATVTTMSDTTLYRIPGQDFLSAVSGSSSAVPPVMELANARLGRSHGPQPSGEQPTGPATGREDHS